MTRKQDDDDDMLFYERLPRATEGESRDPSDLALFVWNRWKSIVDYVPPPLPPLGVLRRLVERCYHASLKIDEGRTVKFSVCFALAQQAPHRHLSAEKLAVFEFESPRRFSDEELRRLSVAANPDSTAILIAPETANSRQLVIRGLIHVGSSWASARKGFAAYFLPPPDALIVKVSGPGHIEVYQGQYLVARLSSGRLSSPKINHMMDWGPPLVSVWREGIGAVSESLRRPKNEPESEWADYEVTSYVNAVLGILNAIQGLNHGGSLLLLSGQASREAAPRLRIKYGFRREGGAQPLRDSFVQFLNLRHEWGELLSRASMTGSRISKQRLELLGFRVAEAGQELSRCISLVGRLAGADGALLLASDLSVIGFGAEIAVPESSRLLPAFEVLDPMLQQRKVFELEQHGMRHRSAVRLVASSPGIVACVVSQDGAVSAAWREDDCVLIRRGIDAVNVDMPFS